MARNFYVAIDRDSLLNLLPKYGVCAEAGVLCGDYSSEILRRTQPRKLYLIDTWKHIPPEDSASPGDDTADQAEHERRYNFVKSRFEREIRSGQVIVRRRDSAATMRALPKGHLDWAYIDASHVEEDVLADLCAAHGAVKRDGLILGHDFIAEEYSNCKPYGVIPAVSRFLDTHPPWGIVLLTHDRHPTFVLGRAGNPLVFQLRRAAEEWRGT